MDLSRQLSDEKKSKPSFWNRLLRISRKSYLKENHDESFKRQSMLYNSLNIPKKETPRSSTSDVSENFMTLESSALQDIHRDAGILFLNKSSIENCFASKEENKHVQFAPTPMNKYYKVNAKEAPSKKQEGENKENLKQTKSIKPTRPILRMDKVRKTSQSSSAEDTESNPETRLLNVTYIDGPKVKTPTIPRTSTKLALVDRKNGSMPHLNVSHIIKYNSLPRNPKIPEESIPFKECQPLTSSNVKSTEYTCNQSTRNISQAINTESRYRSSMRVLNTYRQSYCAGASDTSRIFEGAKILAAQNHELKQDAQRRLSLGPPLHYNYDDAAYHRDCIYSKIHSTQEIQKKKFFNVPVPLKSQVCARSLDQPIRHPAIKQSCQAESNTNKLHKQLYHASTGHIPNKAINEVGLPIVVNKKRNVTSNKTRSKSPQYIQLSETFTSNKMNNNSNRSLMHLNHNHFGYQSSTNEFSEQVIPRKQKANSGPGNPNQSKKQMTGSSGVSNEMPSLISETRKQAILSAMYTKKRKLVNKICKYNSKQSDEGFSSMADDECSFNCSCPSCITKLSRSYKRNGLKQLFSYNKEKYFFTIEPEIKEGNELERLPENLTVEGPMMLAQPHLSNKNVELPQNKTWYECDDTLCQTPGKCNRTETNKGKELVKTPKNKIVDNIYENITEIINSATKKNLTPQDVKRLFTSPISSPFKLQRITPKKLFSNEDEMLKLDQSLKKIFSPAKTSDCFNDSLVLLQEIFQKLSQECKELLQPNISSSSSNQTCSTPISHDSPGYKYMNNLVKNLKSSELSEADFANIIGGIAQNIFSETKAKEKKARSLVHSVSLPDLHKITCQLNKAIKVSKSLKNLQNLQIKEELDKGATATENIYHSINATGGDSIVPGDSALQNRQLPDGWSRTPITEDSNFSSNASSTKLSSSGTDKDSSKFSEGELQLLENAIRLGMGLAPVDKVKKTSLYAASPTKATKYKSRDVLSGKGKLKLKMYYNSGLVTVHVMKAAKLDWTNSRELNAYVKITMTPDESKRVHWRTNVQKAQKNPVFNQKLSFELQAEDATKRLVFSVWHRDYTKQRSELIGCMSFSIRHVIDNNNNIDGWYRLLREKFGTQKHFAAHNCKINCI